MRVRLKASSADTPSAADFLQQLADEQAPLGAAVGHGPPGVPAVAEYITSVPRGALTGGRPSEPALRCRSPRGCDGQQR
jgi:hypothetical protein